MTLFYFIYLTIGLIYTAITFPAYRRIRGDQFNWSAASLYIVWSILFWLPMLAYMLFNKSRR